MATINELYVPIYERLKKIKADYDNAEKQLWGAQKEDEAVRQARIENLQAQLIKIDEYAEKVEEFRLLAEKHIESRNILAITPRELNFNRLRNWAMMINPVETDDPYAQRIYVQTKCNELFLQQKKKEFTERLAELKSDGTLVCNEIKVSVKEAKEKAVTECKLVIESKEFADMALLITKTHAKHQTIQDEEAALLSNEKEAFKIGLGICAQPLPILDEVKQLAKTKMGAWFDERGFIFLPVEHSPEKEMLISVKCAAAKEKKLYRGIQNYLMQLICRTDMGSRKIYFLDGLHYNNIALGPMRPLEGKFVLEPIPRDSDGMVSTLQEIISSFNDIDEQLGMADSVQDYNTSVKPKERIRRTVLVLIGYPSAFSSEAREYIKRILLNYEHYGITPILVDTQYVPKDNEDSSHDVPVDVVENVYRISMTRQREIISQNNGSEHFFKWYELTEALDDLFIKRISEFGKSLGILGAKYTDRIKVDDVISYERGKKSISLPYGIDSKDEMHSLSFDDENFACYLVGASGSGKSTMLHTLITGILKNYHPDDVELWLADFKMSEFAQYMDPLPPHVKYILLDESQELVYDLLDRLTEKMMERQRFFMSKEYRELKKVENVPSSVYMPVIFVILDEFSIMSQAVSESESYKIKLQNLLAKGRALGIKFIFASQTFTKGVAGLTQTAKDQIQTRIAMKNSYTEINETLELSQGTRTEQVRNWMEALPKYYALTKFRDGDKISVERLQVMYFDGKGEKAFEPQRNLIRRINNCMHPVSEEQHSNAVWTEYVNKHPVIVDGNSYKTFQKESFVKGMQTYRSENASELAADDVVLSFGSPRRMVNEKYTVISNESRENILMIARGAEQACGMSLIYTAMNSFEMQGNKVQIWAYHKNRIYRTYKDSHFVDRDVVEGMSAICTEIRKLREKIENKENDNVLIVLLGMEQICNDFELIDFGKKNSATGTGAIVDASKFEASTEEEMRVANEVDDLLKDFKEKYRIDELEEEWIMQDKDIEEIEKEEDRLFEEYLKSIGRESYLDQPMEGQDDVEAVEPKEQVTEQEILEESAYNATEDFKYVVKQGSRFGYHFMLCLSDLSDLRYTHVSQDLFRHRLAFRLSSEDSSALFSTRVATKLPEHVCQYSDSLDQYSLRPFIHQGITWDGWMDSSHS